MGTYQCVCDVGYKQSLLGTSCVDINECLIDNGQCDDICINSAGKSISIALLNIIKHLC